MYWHFASFIECQVVLNRTQLAAWVPSYATDLYIGLSSRNIQSIEVGNFSNLNSLTGLFISFNELSSLDETTFNSLTNLQDTGIRFKIRVLMC